MVALAQALLAFGPLAAEALPTLLVYPVVRPPMLLQLVSACTTLAALAQLAGAAGVQRRTAFHVAAACQLVFDLGQRTMTVLVAQADQAAALGQPPDRRALAALGFLCISQLTAVAGVLRLLRQQAQGNTQAAFARSTAKPGALLPWLLVVLRALELSAPYFELPNPGEQAGREGCLGAHHACGSCLGLHLGVSSCLGRAECAEMQGAQPWGTGRAGCVLCGTPTRLETRQPAQQKPRMLRMCGSSCLVSA